MTYGALRARIARFTFHENSGTPLEAPKTINMHQTVSSHFQFDHTRGPHRITFHSGLLYISLYRSKILKSEEFHIDNNFQPQILYDKDNNCRGDCCNNIGSFCEKCEHIDVVYTWVNGSDPAFLELMRKFAEHDGISKEDDLSPSRFDDKQELKYSLR